MKTSLIDPPSLPTAVNRRYREAGEWVRKRKHLLRSQTDPATWELFAILRTRIGDRRTERGPSHSRLDDDLVRALDIHESGHGLVRAKLQAYLLTSLSYEEIGQRMQEATRVVETYALCFFDVRKPPNLWTAVIWIRFGTSARCLRV